MVFALFQVIFKILCNRSSDGFGLAEHVVPVARIGKEVGLCAGIDAGTEERQGVLRHTYRVVVSDDDLQFSFQVSGFGQETASW